MVNFNQSVFKEINYAGAGRRLRPLAGQKRLGITEISSVLVRLFSFFFFRFIYFYFLKDLCMYVCMYVFIYLMYMGTMQLNRWL